MVLETLFIVLLAAILAKLFWKKPKVFILAPIMVILSASVIFLISYVLSFDAVDLIYIVASGAMSVIALTSLIFIVLGIYRILRYRKDLSKVTLAKELIFVGVIAFLITNFSAFIITFLTGAVGALLESFMPTPF
jgi:hypothetical protein